MKKTFVSVLLALFLCASMGCRHNTANLSNPKVALTVTLLDASNTCVTIEDGINTANSVVERLEAQEPDYYAHVKPLLRKLSSANVTAQAKIVSASNGGADDWKGAMISISASVSPADLTTFGFKNPNTQVIVESGFAGLILALNQIPSKFGGK